jgi:hypothetical protein
LRRYGQVKIDDIRWGWRKDPPDARDFAARRLIVMEMPLPRRYFVYPETIIYDQGSSPSCVGWSAAGIKTDEEFIQYHDRIQFNGEWLYQECKKVDGIPDQDGTFPRMALKILQEKGMRQAGGICLTRKSDLTWKIKGYFRIDPDEKPDFIKQVIYQYGSIMTASTWFREWVGNFDIFPKPITASGGHAYRACGWDDDAGGFIIVNSWGQYLWGQNGMAVMPYSMLTGVVLPEGDCWKLIDA